MTSDKFLVHMWSDFVIHRFTIGIMVLRITGQPVGSVITADEVGAFSIFSFFEMTVYLASPHSKFVVLDF